MVPIIASLACEALIGKAAYTHPPANASKKEILSPSPSEVANASG